MVYWRGFMGGSLLTALTAYILFVTIATGSKRNDNGSIHMSSADDLHPSDSTNAYNSKASNDNRSLNNMLYQVALHRLQSLRRSPNDRHIQPSEHIHSPPADLAFLTQQQQQPSSRRSPRGNNYEPSSSSSTSSSSSSSSTSTRWQQRQQGGNMNISTHGGGGTAAAHPSHDLQTNSSSSSSQQWLSCKARYGTRSFLSPDQRRKPPMLYTFPGR